MFTDIKHKASAVLRSVLWCLVQSRTVSSLYFSPLWWNSTQWLPHDSTLISSKACVCVCLSQCIESVVGGDDYSQSQVNKWTASIVERCLTQLVKQGKPFKYIGTCLRGRGRNETWRGDGTGSDACVVLSAQWHVLWCRKQEQASTQLTPATGTPPWMVGFPLRISVNVTLII